MDIFTFHHKNSTYKDGEIVNGLHSKSWIERYSEPGEFEFTALPTDELREQLAIGTLISHTGTKEVMIVEDHDIKEERGKTPIFKITGRSFDSFLEHRPATDNGMGFKGKNDNGRLPYVLYDGSGWPYVFENITTPELVVELIDRQIGASRIRPGFRIPDVDVSHTIGTAYNRSNKDVPRGDLAPQVRELLEDIKAGIKIVRPSSSHANLKLIVHKGTDRSATVRFSGIRGDLESGHYFWSSRPYRNAAYIRTDFQGKYVALGTSNGLTGMDRRVMFINASDIKQAATWEQILIIDDLLETRAKRALRKQKAKAVFEASVSAQARYRFRQHYDVGDLVYVNGNWGVSSKMRVSEYAEFDGSNGSGGHPTLTPYTTTDDSDEDIWVESQGGESGVTEEEYW